MLQRLFRNAVLALGLTAVLVPTAAEAQVREVVSKQISVGRSEASLQLEFSDEGTLEISFRNGMVLVDGERVGSYEPGGELDEAWRELLGRAVALEDGPLSEALADWTVPADLAGQLADVAREIDRALEASLSTLEVQVDPSAGTVSVSVGGDDQSFLAALLGSANRIGLLPAALSDLGSEVRVHVGENVVVGEDEVVEGSLVVIDGSVGVYGQVEGTVVVIGGSFDLAEDGEVEGEVRLADTRVVRTEGRIGGGLIQLDERAARADVRVERDVERIREEVRRDVRRELERELRRADRAERDDSFFAAPVRRVARATGGLLENVFTILILGLLGAAAVMFAGQNVDVIAETARRSPGRSAMVGLAGTFLLLPAWVLGFVALVVSIIGIPVAIAWLPLFPIAAVLAAVLGYLAVARNAGEWLADSHYPWTGWIRKSNPLLTMVGGLVGLMALFVAANVLSVVPFFGVVTGLFTAAAIVLTFVAVQVGFGAVLLTRAGRRREYWSTGYTADEAWEAAMSVDVEDEGTRKTREEPSDVGGEDGNDA